VAFKLTSKIRCPTCCRSLTSRHEEFDDTYIDDLNRGGLTVPSKKIIDIGKHVFGVMSKLISEEYEEEFLLQHAQKKLLVSLVKIGITSDRNLLFENNCPCGIDNEYIVNNSLSIFCNILITTIQKKK
jgi:hypothetical protein